MPRNRRLEVAAVQVIGISRKAAVGFDRIAATGEDRNSVPAFLPMPDRAIAGVGDGAPWETLFGRLQFLEANDVGLGLRQPAQQDRPSGH